MIKRISKNEKRIDRKSRSREKLRGTHEKPRLVVFKSLKNVYVQLIDDEKQSTILSMSTLNNEDFAGLKSRKNKKAMQKIGEMTAQKSIESGIKKIVFDRNGYKYHGNIKLFADTLRSKGLIF